LTNLFCNYMMLSVSWVRD